MIRHTQGEKLHPYKQLMVATTQIAYHRKKWISPALREFLLIVGQHAVEWRQSGDRVTTFLLDKSKI
ncbi:hypothetical protein [Desulfosporosinus burensis]